MLAVFIKQKRKARDGKVSVKKSWKLICGGQLDGIGYRGVIRAMSHALSVLFQ
jgi:hypothetical protein